MLVGVVLAVGISAALFIGANLWFDQTKRNWVLFSALTGGILGGVLGGILVGNALMIWRFSLVTRDLDIAAVGSPAVYIIGLAVIGAVYGGVLSGSTGRNTRLLIGALGGAVLGLTVGLFVHEAYYPAWRAVEIIAWPVGGIVVMGGLFAARSGNPIRGALLGAALGWLLGTFLIPSLGGGTRVEAILSPTITGLLFGMYLGWGEPRDNAAREALGNRARATIFLAPALLFIGITLVVPTIITVLLSLRDKTGAEYVGFSNYTEIFSDGNIIRFDRATNAAGEELGVLATLFNSPVFVIGVALLVLGIIYAFVTGRRRGGGLTWSGASATSAALGLFVMIMLFFTVFRGVIANNLWWVFAVTLIASAMGLAIAVLADRAKFESLAKSLIFMPMAISFVGAGIIWRFMYVARPPQKDQTGVFNTLWVGLGEISNSDSRWILAGVFGLFVLGLAYIAYRGFRANATGLVAGSLGIAAPVVWFMYSLLGPGIGGFARDPETGEAIIIEATGALIPEAIIFTQTPPWNNFFLMVVLIWIQVGFTMVIFSAAIKAVPGELIEASNVDGASESQTFWSVIIPQIAPTIGVVVTTLIVLVMKVFDIVKVMTNGNFDSQVLANAMWQRAFTELDFGRGAALAALIFLSVLPIMYINIRRIQKAEV